MIPGRYLPTYRQDEVSQIARAAQIGQSVAYVGIAGVGKSNLVRYVRDPFHIAPFVGEMCRHIRFPLMAINAWDGSSGQFWQSMVFALIDITGDKPTQEESSDNQQSPAFWLNALKERLNKAFQDPQARIMFILNDSDSFFLNAPYHLIEQLSALRNEHYQDLLSFLFFTKKLPHVLLRHNNPDRLFEIHDLFRNRVFSLGPYSRPDARQMLTHLMTQSDNLLPRQDINAILALSGGHPRLLYFLFNLWIRDPIPTHNRVGFLATHPIINNECHRIIQGLHRHEQEAAIHAATRGYNLEYVHLLEHLRIRGILAELNPLEWFSPIMPMTLATCELKGEI